MRRGTKETLTSPGGGASFGSTEALSEGQLHKKWGQEEHF